MSIVERAEEKRAQTRQFRNRNRRTHGRGEESERLFSTTYTIYHFTTHPVVLCGEARETLAEPLARFAALRLHADLVRAARVEIVDAAHAVDGDLLGRGRGLLCLALGH